MAEALYRKYRPQTFGDMVGQAHIETTIRHALERGSLAHAYLFCGPRGTGKTTSARLLAKVLLCEHGPTATPDGTCEACKEIAQGVHPDVFELDAASRTGVDNVREEILSRVHFAPTKGRFKVYIIDEAHMLSPAAFNAMLKTLEEPPAHVIFVLCTTDPQKVLDTVKSRCQRFDFRRISSQDIAERLRYVCKQEGVTFESEALDLIALRSDGGMRNALSSLEQIIAFSEGQVSLASAEAMLGSFSLDSLVDFLEAVGTRNMQVGLTWISQFLEEGGDLAQFCVDVSAVLRDLYVFKLVKSAHAANISEARANKLARIQDHFSLDRITHVLDILTGVSVQLKLSTNPRLLFEVALMRMARPECDLSLEALSVRIQDLEQALASARVSSGEAPPVNFAPSVANAEALVGQLASGTGQGAEQLESATPASQGMSNTQVDSAAAQSTPVNSALVASATAIPVAGQTVSVAPDQSQVASVSNQAFTSLAAPVSSAVQSEQPAGASQLNLFEVKRNVGSAIPTPVIRGLSNAAAIQRLWRKTQAELAKTKPAYNVMLLGSYLTFDAAIPMVVINVPTTNQFALESLASDKVLDHISQALAQSATATLPFRFAPIGGGVPAAQAKAEPFSSQMPMSAGQVALDASQTKPVTALETPVATPRGVAVPGQSTAGNAVVEGQGVARQATRATQGTPSQQQSSSASGLSASLQDRLSAKVGKNFVIDQVAGAASTSAIEAPAYEPVPYDDVEPSYSDYNYSNLESANVVPSSEPFMPDFLKQKMNQMRGNTAATQSSVPQSAPSHMSLQESQQIKADELDNSTVAQLEDVSHLCTPPQPLRQTGKKSLPKPILGMTLKAELPKAEAGALHADDAGFGALPAEEVVEAGQSSDAACIIQEKGTEQAQQVQQMQCAGQMDTKPAELKTELSEASAVQVTQNSEHRTVTAPALKTPDASEAPSPEPSVEEIKRVMCASFGDGLVFTQPM